MLKTRLEVLALTGRLVLHKVLVWSMSPFLLLLLASLEREQITELHSNDIECTTEEEGRALASLLERCHTWSVEALSLYGQLGGHSWGLLGQESRRRRLRYVLTEREVVGRGRREDILTVWGNTEVAWWVDGEWIYKVDGEGWGKLEKIFQ